MKSKELIKLLQENDPDGETEVCVGNVPVSYVDILPAFYDGYMQLIEMDDNGKPISAKRTGSGFKIDLGTYSIADLIEGHPWADIDYSNLDEWRRNLYRDADEATRKSYYRMKNDICKEHFVKYISGIVNDFDSADRIKCEEFYDKHLKHDAPLPVGKKIDNRGNPIVQDSVHNRRELAWSHQVRLHYNEKFEFDLEFIEGVDVSNIQCSYEL